MKLFSLVFLSFFIVSAKAQKAGTNHHGKQGVAQAQNPWHAEKHTERHAERQTQKHTQKQNTTSSSSSSQSVTVSAIKTSVEKTNPQAPQKRIQKAPGVPPVATTKNQHIKKRPKKRPINRQTQKSKHQKNQPQRKPLLVRGRGVKPATKTSTHHRQVANTDPDKVSYSQLVFPSKDIYQTVNQHLQNIVALCQSSKSSKEKLKIFKKEFKALKSYVKNTLDEYLKVEDEFYLSDIYSHIKTIHLELYTNSTSALQVANSIHGALLAKYRYNYNIPKSQSVNLTPGWMHSMTQGLSCIK